MVKSLASKKFRKTNNTPRQKKATRSHIVEDIGSQNDSDSKPITKSQTIANSQSRIPPKEDFVSFFKRIRTYVILGIIAVLFSLVFDLPFIALITMIRNYSHILIKFFSFITVFGDSNYFFVLLVLITLVLLLMKEKVISLWAAEISAIGVGFALKYLIMRPRPFEIFGTQSLIPVSSSSFPSGHSLVFFTLLPILNAKFPKMKFYFWTIAILIGFSRIYLGVHFLSDVMAGAFLGYTIGYIFLFLGEKYEWK